MTVYTKAPQEVIDMARDLIVAHHPDLWDAGIGFLMVDKASTSGGKVVWGRARKVSAELQVYIDHDFLITLAEDIWYTLSEDQQRALVDHELMHCYMDGAKAKTRDHDITEFYAVIKRHGLWWPTADRLKEALQPHLPFAPSDEDEPPRARTGRVVSVDGEILERLSEALSTP